MNKYIVAGSVPCDNIIELIKSEFETVLLFGKQVKLYGSRLKNFVVNGTKCKCCSIEGTHFNVEKQTGGNQWDWHLNLYAKDKDGADVMLTRDHVKLRSLGGKDTVLNYSTMCSVCNELRGDYYDDQEEFIKAYHNGTVHEEIMVIKSARSVFAKSDMSAHVFAYRRKLKAELEISKEKSRNFFQRQKVRNTKPKRIKSKSKG